MTKVVNGAVTKSVDPGPDGLFNQVISQDVVTKFYDDGRVIQQYGRFADWVQICDPDKFVHEVGICTKCGRMITGDEEWEYPKSGSQSVWHTFEEDCTKKNEADDEDN